MTSEAIRDPVKDHLLTPQNSALIEPHYQMGRWMRRWSFDRQSQSSANGAVSLRCQSR
jgi:hypothetical protein